MRGCIIRILLVEDDKKECDEYVRLVEKTEDIKIIAITNSSKEAISILKKQDLDVVILDLDLNNGEGSGIEFVKEMASLKLTSIPKMIVNTNICSDSVYNFLYKNKVDFIFYKSQVNYLKENVIDTAKLLCKYSDKKAMPLQVDNKNIEEKVINAINKELNLIGIGTHLTGRKYLVDAIKFIIDSKTNESDLTVIQFLVNKYKKSGSTITRAMQNGILHAWRISSVEDLEALYTARVNYETGVPTPTEFIYYYADKVEKMGLN